MTATDHTHYMLWNCNGQLVEAEGRGKRISTDNYKLLEMNKSNAITVVVSSYSVGNQFYSWQGNNFSLYPDSS
jgi:hypothetical protein